MFSLPKVLARATEATQIKPQAMEFFLSLIHIYGDAKAVASSEDKTFSYIPKTDKSMFREDADYVYICMNNTIYGHK